MNELLVFLVGTLVGIAVTALLIRRRPYVSPGPASGSSAPASARSARASTSDDVLERISEGVVVVNDLLRPVLANRAARDLLDVDEAKDLLPDELMSIVRRAITGQERVEDVIELWTPSRTSVRVTAEALDQERGVVLSLRDVSTEERANRVRRQFVAHASHELKTPVTSIQTLAEAINSAVADDHQAVEDFAHKLLIETARLAKLIEDLLDLSRLEDPGSFSRRPVLVTDVALNEIDLVRERAERDNIKLEAEVADDIWAQGDEQQLSLLVRNLLDNAVRYTPRDGTVRLALGRREDQVVVTVDDDGIGIPLKAQARVFERFFRVDEARSRDRGGTGLGLAIVRHVADLYGGRVELRSEFGEGSTFTVYLPASDPAPADATA